MPAVVLGELHAGFRQGTRRARNEAELDAFLAHALVEVLPVDDSVARIYGEMFAALRKAARPLPANDIWIPAAASRAGAPVLTYDEHFRSIARVGSLVLPRPDREAPGT